MAWTGLGRVRLALLYAVCTMLVELAHGQTLTRATSVPILLPGAMTFDPAGNLYFVETAKQAVRRVDTNGVLTTVAGTGVQGFSGDGGAATAATLDCPAGLVYLPPGVLYVADTHNDRVRRIDLGTGVISTVAGTSVRGFAGDGGVAVAAELSLPSGLAVSAAGVLYVADVGNHRVRRVDALGVIATVAGNGAQGLGGDGGAATAASLDSMTGLALDGAGNLLIADTHNGRVRRVDAVTGTITSVSGPGGGLPRGVTVDEAGNIYVAGAGAEQVRRVGAGTGLMSVAIGAGIQGFAGDGGPATMALVDSPSAVSVSPGGLLTVADTSNGRIRQVDAAGILHTIAGLGTTVPGTLTLTGPTVAEYGTGDVTATLVTSPATGAVTFLDGASTLAATPLQNNVAVLSTDQLMAGMHRLMAVYPGDALHGAAESGTVALMVSPAGATVKPDAETMVYGQVVPRLTGTITGVLARDLGAVSAVYTTTAGMGVVPGVYPITATLTGVAAGNYALTLVPAAVTVGKAGSTAVLTGSGPGLSARVTAATSGTPSGGVTLLDGTMPVGTAQLVGGVAEFGMVVLAAGTHTLTGVYGGDGNFLGATSAAVVESVGVGTAADFTLVATGTTTLTVPSGAAATYSFSVTPAGAPLASPILLTASGLPPGASANFNPAYLPPGNTVQAFLMAVSTPKASLGVLLPFVVAFLLPLLMLDGRRRKIVMAAVVSVGLAGCGDRVNTGAVAGLTVKAYTITVTGTATDSAGATVTHTAKVMLNVQ